MQKVKLKKRLICADADGKERFCGAKFVGYMDEQKAKYLLALGEVEFVDETEPEPEPVPEPEPEPAAKSRSKPKAVAEAEDAGDQPDL